MKKRDLIYFIFVALLFQTSCNCMKPNTTVDTPKSYSVYYYNDGIDSARNEIKVSDEEYFQITSVPQKEGYDFLGYYDNMDSGEKVINASGYSMNVFNYGKNITLYARWKPKQCTISLNLNGGELSLETQIDVLYNDEIHLTDYIPQKAGYKFLGWYSSNTSDAIRYTDSKGNLGKYSRLNTQNYPSIQNSNILDLYAKYEKKSVKVTLYYGDSEPLQKKQIEVPYSNTIEKYAGDIVYTLNGELVKVKKWSTVKNDEHQQYIFTGPIDREGIILYPCLTAKVYTITFNNGNSIEKFGEKNEKISLPNPTKTNYYFVGWKNENDIIFNADNPYYVSSDETLTAEWAYVGSHEVSLRVGEKKITDDGRENNHYDILDLSLYYDFDMLKKAGYQSFKLSFSFDVTEIDDGYRYLFLYNSEIVDDAYKLFGKEFEVDDIYSDNNWVNVKIDTTVNILALNYKKVFIRWGASGDWNDDWKNKNLVVKITPVK